MSALHRLSDFPSCRHSIQHPLVVHCALHRLHHCSADGPMFSPLLSVNTIRAQDAQLQLGVLTC